MVPVYHGERAAAKQNVAGGGSALDQFVQAQGGEDALLSGVGALGEEGAAVPRHNPGGLDLAHSVGGPRGDGGAVREAEVGLGQGMAQDVRQAGQDGGRLLSCQDAVGVKSAVPTPLTTPRPAICMTL